MKRTWSATVAAALLAAVTASPAAAASRTAYRLQGAAVALGTVGVVAALASADAHAAVYVPAAPGYGVVRREIPRWPDDSFEPDWGCDCGDDPRYDRGHRHGRHDCRDRVWVPGQWVTVRVWVPGGWQDVWQPGWYDGGRWRPGAYVRRALPGRHEARREWREGYYR